MNQEIAHAILRNADKQTYTSLRAVSQDFQRTASNANKLLMFPQTDSKTAFYEGYQLAAYQNAMLKHLNTHGLESVYKVIADWENLFLITLLYAYVAYRSE